MCMCVCVGAYVQDESVHSYSNHHSSAVVLSSIDHRSLGLPLRACAAHSISPLCAASSLYWHWTPSGRLCLYIRSSFVYILAMLTLLHSNWWLWCLQLDDMEPDKVNMDDDGEEEPDFYEQAHMPVWRSRLCLCLSLIVPCLACNALLLFAHYSTRLGECG